MVTFGILGPVQVSDRQRRLPIGGPRQLRLLAYLVLHANRAVSSDQLIDALWREQDPAGAMKRLQVAVARLRKALDPLVARAGGEAVLRTVCGGYLLEVGVGELDADLFATRLGDGRRALEQGDVARAADVLREGLALWRGPALAEVAYEEFAQAEIRRLEELRLAALEARLDADLLLGRHAEIIGELEALIASHPTRERLAAQLMLALYRCGRQADALDAYQRTRAHLAGELGLQPGPALTALQAQILQHAPALQLVTDQRIPPAGRQVAAEAVLRVDERARAFLAGDERSQAGARELPGIQGRGGGAESAEASPPASRLPGGGRRGALPPILAAVERTPVIGRGAELRRLELAFRAAKSAGPSIATVSGEAGIGKTRLIGEFADLLHRQGLPVIYGAASREPTTPYEPFLEGLGHHIAHAPADELSRLRGIDPPIMRRLLPELHPEPAPGGVEPALDDQPGTLRALRALARMFEELAGGRPLLVALDDMHWADPGSVHLLAHLIRSIPPAPLMILVAYREAEAPIAIAHALDRAQRRVAVERLRLPALAEPDVDALIGAWGGATAPSRFSREIYERTEGNPLFIGQLMRHLVGTGAVDAKEGRWASAADISALGVPHEIRELVDLRLATLGEQASQVLGVAAVIGHNFPLVLVERVTARPDGAALDALETALHGGLLVEDPGDPGGFRFAHALVRDSIYGRLSGPRRARLHLAVAQAIQNVYADDLDAHRVDLARHFLRAAQGGEDARPAIRAALDAAEQARRLFAYEQAEAHYRNALDLLRRAPDRETAIRARERLGDIQAMTIRYADAINTYRGALAGVDVVDHVRRARLHRKIARTQLRAYDEDAASATLDQAQRELGGANDSDRATSEAIELALERLTLLYWRNDTSAMSGVIRDAQALIERQADPIHQIRLLHSIMISELRVRRHQATKETVDLAERGLALARGRADPVTRANAEFQLGFCLIWAKEPDRALTHLSHARRLSADAHDLLLGARTAHAITLAHRHARRLTDTEASARAALAAAEAADIPMYRTTACANLAWVACQTGQHTAAREHARLALAQLGELAPPHRILRDLALWPLIALALHDGEIDRAIDYSKQLLDPQQRGLSPPLQPQIEALMKSAIDHHRTDPPEASRTLQRVLSLADGITLPAPASTAIRAMQQ